MFDLTSFRNHLRARRKELNMTQSQLGAACGVSAQEISHFENGRRAPELEMLIKLCNALDTTPNALLWDYVGPSAAYPSNRSADEQLKDYIHNAMRELKRLDDYYNS